MDVLLIGNDQTLELKGLRDANGAFIAGATADAVLYESDGVTEVSGASWPLTLSYIGKRGTYRAQLPTSLNVVNDRRYELKLTAVYAGKKFEVRRHVQAEDRYS